MGYVNLFGLFAVIVAIFSMNIGLTKQQDQNYFFSQQQGRFPASFSNPRNGFFPSQSAAAAVAPIQNAPPGTSYQTNSFFLTDDEQQQQQQQQQQFQETTQGYVPYSSFASNNVPQSNSYFEISPRPFTLQPTANHGFQYAPPPPRPSNYQQQQQKSTQQNRNILQSSSLLPQTQPLRYENQGQQFGFLHEQSQQTPQQQQQQYRLTDSITPKPQLFSQQQQQSQQPFSRTRSYLHDQNLSGNGFIEPTATAAASIASNSNNNNNQFFPRNSPFKKPNEYVTSHESSIRSKNRFQTTAAIQSPSTINGNPTSIEPPSASGITGIADTSTVPTTSKSRRTGFNPYRSIVTPRHQRIKSTTTTTTTLPPAPIVRSSASATSHLLSASSSSAAISSKRFPNRGGSNLIQRPSSSNPTETIDHGGSHSQSDRYRQQQQQHQQALLRNTYNRGVINKSTTTPKITSTTKIINDFDNDDDDLDEDQYNESKFDDQNDGLESTKKIKSNFDDYYYDNPNGFVQKNKEKLSKSSTKKEQLITTPPTSTTILPLTNPTSSPNIINNNNNDNNDSLNPIDFVKQNVNLYETIKPIRTNDKQLSSDNNNQGEYEDDNDNAEGDIVHENKRKPINDEDDDVDFEDNDEQQSPGEFIKDSTDEDQPVILHSNFYLPDGGVAAANTDKEDEVVEQITGEATTHKTNDYEYEYVEYEDETVSPTLSSPSQPTVEQKSTSTKNPTESTTLIPAELNEPTISDVFISQSPNVKLDFKSEPIDGELLHGGYKESDDNDDEHIVGKAVVSVVTTKSVLNGSTPNLIDLTTKSNNKSPTVDGDLLVNDDVVEIFNSSNASQHATLIDDESSVGDNVESNNSSTESWVVVASVQTSRSVSGARFLPFAQVEQDEKKQSLADLDMKTSDEDEDEEDEDDGDLIGDHEESTTVPYHNDVLSTTVITPKDDVDDDSVIVDASEITTDSIQLSPTTENTPSASSIIPQSTESIIDKLDRVQSELSSVLLAGKFPIINDMSSDASSSTSTTELPTTIKNPGGVVIRRFTPRTSSTSATTPKSNDKKISFDTLPMDDLTVGLLPFGFKPRNNSYRNKKITTTTSTTTEQPELTDTINGLPESSPRYRNANISRSFKNNPNVQNLGQSNLTKNDPKELLLLSKLKFEDNLEKLLPKDYKEKIVNSPVNSTYLNKQKHPYVPSLSDTPSGVVGSGGDGGKFPPSTSYRQLPSTVTKKPQTAVTAFTDNVNKFLPPGYKPSPADSSSTTTTKDKKVIPVTDDINKFLPPGYKPPGGGDLDIPALIPIDDKLLPHNFKPNRPKLTGGGSEPTKKFELPVPKIHKFSENDLSKLIPSGYKPSNDKESSTILPPPPTAGGDSIVESLLNKVKFKDVSDLLPPGFKLNNTNEIHSTAVPAVAVPFGTKPSPPKLNGGLSVVFPKGIIRKPGVRITTPAPAHVEGPAPPEITIRHGLRTTTEFTGWPSPPTTPFSIEKLLEQQRAESIDISELLGHSGGSSSSSSSTTTTTTTTSTTTTTVRPTQPGHCRSECNLAGTIKIIDGVKWTPELLDHNTAEWKNLAMEIEAQLNEVYNKSFSKWYKKIRIDSFSQGSVLVDYFVELIDVNEDINTLQIKRMFHEALREVPISVIPLQKDYNDDDDDGDNDNFNINSTSSSIEKMRPSIKENVLLGKFILDPFSTDFIVIPKQILPTVVLAETSLIPQWAIAVIVIGFASLLFVIIFGVGVLVNRQKRSKKKQPIQLTADMLNELNKNHMGGVENYGQEELYNPDDTWTEKKHPLKTKRFSNSMHGSSSNIYDSWRSQHHNHRPLPTPSVTDHHFYDTHNNYMKSPNYPPPLPPDPYSLMDSHVMMEPIYNHHHPVHQQQQQQHHLHHPNDMGLYTYNNNHKAPAPPHHRRYHRDYDPEF